MNLSFSFQLTSNSSSLHFKSSDTEWYRPETVEELLELKHQHPHAKLVGGNTEIGGVQIVA